MADSATNPAVPVKMEGDVIVEFNEASSRQQINSGESVKTLFGKLRKFLADLKAVAFSGAYGDLSDKPESLPANGGNADTVDGLHANEIASNPNLLINPDFKINQRGNTAFTVSYHTGSPIPQSQLYTVDRWRLMEGKADILEGKFVLNGTIIQVLENGIGENFTASVSVESGAATASYDDSTKTFTIVGDVAVLNWAKLEYGSIATPFIQPDPTIELVKCKRYYRAFGPNFTLNTVGRYYHNKNNQFTYYLDVPMRVNPDVIFTNCGVKLVSEPYSDIEVNSYNSLSTKYALFVYCTMDNLYDDAMFYVKSENGLELDAEIK